jgi:L-rhamnose mutarotase
MIENNKYAWVWEIKPEYLDEYVKMHLDPWPEIMEEHTKAGIRNYSIFQNGTQFIYVFECDDVKKAFEYLDNSKDCQRWNAITGKMVKDSFDFSAAEPIKFLPKVFYLK